MRNKRAMSESNGPGRFCRPPTKPLIQLPKKINNLHDWHFHSLSSTRYHTDLQHSLLISTSSVSLGICCLTQSLLEPRLFIGCLVGFEPTTSGTTIRRSNHLNYRHHVADRVRFELTDPFRSAPQQRAGLNHSPIYPLNFLKSFQRWEQDSNPRITHMIG